MNIKEKLKLYIKNNLENDNLVFRKRCSYAKNTLSDYEFASTINDFIEENKNENNFQRLLFDLIDKKNLKDSDVYNKVNLDRRLFSKIRNDNAYHPSKNTVILLGLSLELNEQEIISLLESASYSLPKNNNRDLIIRFCFIEKIYDPIKINELLYSYNCQLLEK